MTDYKSLVAKGPEAYIKTLMDIGWFEQPQNKIDEIAAQLLRFEDNNHFVLALSHLSFDAEGFESADEYKKVLHDMAKLAGIKFTSIELDFSFSEEADTLNGDVITANDSYWLELENLIGWFDPEVVDFMNDDVLEGEGVEGRIFDLPAVDQFAQFVFVPRELYDKAVEHGLIPEDADYFINDFDEE
ncbi:hypothetical protein [Flavobacterium psychrotrophum]|uniref:hypothetical protein n=1 Tax=Flavobacterium psychrotrophum TaxID=2294119 RepID=UPI000E31A81A|nr:hypothetical protein [Flavobacterium psychrotrophum]